jgi:hypothetical protein
VSDRKVSLVPAVLSWLEQKSSVCQGNSDQPEPTCGSGMGSNPPKLSGYCTAQKGGLGTGGTHHSEIFRRSKFLEAKSPCTDTCNCGLSIKWVLCSVWIVWENYVGKVLLRILLKGKKVSCRLEYMCAFSVKTGSPRGRWVFLHIVYTCMKTWEMYQRNGSYGCE